MPQFPYLVSNLLYDIVETVNKKNYRLYENYRLLSVASKASSPLQREFEAKKTDAHRMHAAPANSAMFISQVTFFCFELSSRARAVRESLVRAHRLLVGHAQAASRTCAVRESVARARRHLVGHAQAASVAVGRGARDVKPFSNGNHQFGRGCPPQEYEHNMVLGKASTARTHLVRNMVHGPVPAARSRGGD